MIATPAPWVPLFNRGEFALYVMTRAYIQEEHGSILPTPFIGEIRTNSGGVHLQHFSSERLLADFVLSMEPTVTKICHAAGELVHNLAAWLQAETLH